MALTMTAELADVFESKREGVLFVLDAVALAFPGCRVHALDLNGVFVPLAAARLRPLDFAAANWLATALWLGQQYRHCLLVDVGSTTCDIIPILEGRPGVTGRTDLARLQAGELVYTGALRTNIAAVVQAIPVKGALCPVASEYFAISGDVHLVLGNIAAADYTCPTPDGRPATAQASRARLARLVCADREQLDDAEIDAIARYVYERQVEQIGQGLAQVLSRLGGRLDLPLLPLGMGAFLAYEVARRMGLRLLDFDTSAGSEVSAVAPSWAAAHLLLQQLREGALA
jgi:probable H4MPT-linked C1 transfer pathway protein